MSACNSLGNQISKKTSDAPNDRGIVLFSLTRTGLGPYTGLIYWRYRQFDDFQKKDSISVEAQWGNNDWDSYTRYNEYEKSTTIPLIGNLYAIELPPGKYEFYDYCGRGNQFTIRPASTFSFVFNVNPGEIDYIGNLDIDFGMSRPTASQRIGSTGINMKVQVSDNSTRDLAVAKNRFPALRLEKVNHFIMINNNVLPDRVLGHRDPCF